ncbi:MAG: N-6 DNA methylase [Acidobacteriota bacterium]|nr:N-6 DNA methylase [Acidobacteriota bacterium]
MSYKEPAYQTSAIFGKKIQWQHLQSEDWEHLHLPGHLADQVFRILIAQSNTARFFEISVSEQCPKETYTHLARGIRRLGHEMAVINVIHNRNAGGHLIFWRKGSPVTFHHLDLEFTSPSSLDTEVMRCLSTPTPSNLETMYRLLDGKRIQESLFRTLRSQLDLIDAKDEETWLTLVDLVLKLVFLIFVQRKGWLNFDQTYLENRMRACHGRSMSIVHCLFRPLFARLEGFRESEPVELGVLPRLGGGLFRFQPERLPKIENTWCMTLYETLVSQFSFSLFEARDDRAIVGVSPEVLGHVFENLLRGKSRKKQGVYYTPAHVAEKQVNEAFRINLGAQTRPDVARLRRMRILDPSCGSGTYLVAAFQTLLKYRLAQTPVHERYNGKLYELKRQIVQENLYGIDINPMAVRLTEVRLWLNMIQDLEIDHPEAAPPLPNLQHHLRPGDFLARFEPQYDSRLVRWQKHEQLKRLRQKFPESPPGHRTILLRHIYRLERELFDYLLAEESKDRCKLVRAALAQKPLPGFEQALPEPDKAPSDHGVMLHAVFSDVILTGGFDLIVGNPPWLRGNLISPAQKQRFRRLGQVPKGLRLGGQMDLSLYFVAAVLRLLKPGGHLGFLLPGKLLQAQYAAGLRQFLATRFRIDYLYDYGIDDKLLFKADTFPLALGLTRALPSSRHRVKIERHGRDFMRGHTLHQHDLSNASGAWTLEIDDRGPHRDWPKLKDGFFRIQKGLMTNGKQHFVFSRKPDFLPPAHLRPLLRGRDIQTDSVIPGNWVYWPFGSGPDWYNQLFPEEYSWLKATGKLRLSPARLPYTYRRTAPWLVIWKYLASSWQAALVCNQGWIPDQTTYYVEFTDYETAYRYFVYFNSKEADRQLTRIAERGKTKCFFFYKHTCGELALPPDLMTRHLDIPQPADVFTPGQGRRASEMAGWEGKPE